jgi:hypothetical protein
VFALPLHSIGYALPEENKKVIGREGAIPPLVLLLRSNVDKIQRNSAVTLKNLSTNNGTTLFAVFPCSSPTSLLASHTTVHCTVLGFGITRVGCLARPLQLQE